jgi:hypothetical protein
MASVYDDSSSAISPHISTDYRLPIEITPIISYSSNTKVFSTGVDYDWGNFVVDMCNCTIRQDLYYSVRHGLKVGLSVVGKSGKDRTAKWVWVVEAMDNSEAIGKSIVEALKQTAWDAGRQIPGEPQHVILNEDARPGSVEWRPPMVG